MDLKYLQKLIKMLDSSNLAEIEIEEEGTKIKLSKPRPKVTAAGSFMQTYNPVPVFMQEASSSQESLSSTQETSKSASEAKEDKSEDNFYEVRSPMVGTFYRAPSPDADPYVKVGSEIKQGSIICIIEAMKLMNEIEAEVSGKVVKMLVENGQAVEYNQPLFLVEVNK